MKDHKAPRRSFSPGVPSQENQINVHQGVGGVVKPGYNQVRSDEIVVEGYGLKYKVKAQVVTCEGKNGTCKARPIKGTTLCVGHTKAKEKELLEQAGD